MTTPLLLPVLQAAQAAPPPDTVVTVAARDGVDLIYALAAGSVVATFLGLLVAIVIVLLQLRKAGRALDEARRAIAADRGMESARRVAENMADISRSLRNDVTKVSDSVAHLSDRLTQVSNRMEERVEEFNALMEVVQEEAEEVFVDSASTARGVRAGVGNLRRRARGRARSRLDERRAGGETGADSSIPASRTSPRTVPEERPVEAGRRPEDGETRSE